MSYITNVYCTANLKQKCVYIQVYVFIYFETSYNTYITSLPKHKRETIGQKLRFRPRDGRDIDIG